MRISRVGELSLSAKCEFLLRWRDQRHHFTDTHMITRLSRVLSIEIHVQACGTGIIFETFEVGFYQKIHMLVL